MALSGCMGSNDPDANPSTETPDVPDIAVTGQGLRLVASLSVSLLNDIAFRPGFVYGSAQNAGTYIFDVTDPSAPQETAMVPCTGIDVGVVDLASGRRILTISHDGPDGCPGASQTGGLRLVDITDPAEPLVLGQVDVGGAGSHTNTPWGDSGLVFVSDPFQAPGRSTTAIVDINDPEQPAIVGRVPLPPGSTSGGCHDITADVAHALAVCSAGYTETQLWDMSDPFSPRVVSTIRNPMMQIHHWAAVGLSATLLVLGDESGGAVGPACSPPAPVGALWAYDISDRASPVQKGYFVPPRAVGPAVCTAHYFNFVGDGPLLVGGFYTAGTVLVDFADPAAPRLLDQQAPPSSNVWSSYWNAYDGRVYVGDWGRGLDVFELV